MMKKEDYTPEELRETAEAIRSATLPKSITPEMVGGTLLGILSLLGGKASGSGALESVLPRLTARSGFIKLSLDLTKADGTVDNESAFVNLPAATDSLAGLMTNVQNKVVNSLPPTIVTEPYFVASGDVVTLKSKLHNKGAGDSYSATTASLGSLPTATETQGGVMTRAQVKKLSLLDKVLFELTGIGDECSLEIYAGWNPEITSMSNMFQDNKTIKYFPKVDTSKVTDATCAFDKSSLAEIAHIDTSALTKADFMFNRCPNLKTIPPLDFSNCTSAVCVFEQSGIEVVPALDFSKCTTTGWGMFGGCRKLRKVGRLDFSKCARLENLFMECSSLEAVVPFVEPKVAWNGKCLFMDCAKLPAVPEVDLSLCTQLQHAFQGLVLVTNIGVLSTGNCTNFHCSFRFDYKLERLECVDAAKVRYLNSTFEEDSALKYLKILNLGTVQNAEASNTFRGVTSWGAGSEENRQSLVDSLLTYSFDRAAAGYAPLAFQLEPEVLARLTDEEIAAITAKGFTLTSY